MEREDVIGGYSCEPPAFYRKWFHGEEGWEELVGAEWAVGASQGRHAEEFLAIFRRLLTHPDGLIRSPMHVFKFAGGVQIGILELEEGGDWVKRVPPSSDPSRSLGFHASNSHGLSVGLT